MHQLPHIRYVTIEHLELVVLGHIGLWTSHRMVRTVLVYVHIG